MNTKTIKLRPQRGSDPTGTTAAYTVIEATNTTRYLPGSTIMRAEVDDLCRDGQYDVRIVEPRRPRRK